MSQVFVRGNEYLETSTFRRTQEIAVLQGSPPLSKRRFHLAIRKRGPNSTRNTVVKQDTFHAAAELAGGMERRANSSTAMACSRVTPSNSSKNSFKLIPASRLSNSASTGTRVP